MQSMSCLLYTSLLLPMYLEEEEGKERLQELGEPQEKWEELKQEQKRIYEKAQDLSLIHI